MKKRHRFDKLDDLLREEYERKVREIEDDLSDDGSFDPDKVDSDMLLSRIKKQIQEREKEKEEIVRAKKEKRYRVVKVAGFFFVAGVAVFCASMTSEANRTYLNDKIQYLRGNEVVIRVGGDKGKEIIENDEKELVAYQEIQEQIGIPVPTLGYKPNIKKEFAYNIMHKDTAAVIQYRYEDMTIELYMVNKKYAEASGLTLHGKKIKNIDVMGGLLTIPIQQIKDKDDISSNYAAQWEYEDGYYQVNGKVSEKDFLKIVENILY